jgi:hypothetical protein
VASICPFTCRGNPEWVAASASGQMLPAGIKNKYGFDMQVSAADMAGQILKRP